MNDANHSNEVEAKAKLTKLFGKLKALYLKILSYSDVVVSTYSAQLEENVLF
jgi:hypothetical protein